MMSSKFEDEELCHIAKDIDKIQEEREREFGKKTEFGAWVYNPSTYTLSLREYEPAIGGHREILLDDIKDSAGILDWYHYAVKRSWCTPQVLYDLVKAIGYLLQPQENYCSSGEHKTKSAVEILDKMYPRPSQ